MNKYLHDISNVDFYFDHSSDISELTRDFSNKLDNMYKLVFPLRTKFLSHKRLSKPWISSALLKSIKRKSFLFKQYKLQLISKDYYTRYRNLTTKLIRDAKSSYFKRLFGNSGNDARKSWKLIKNLIGEKTNSSPSELIGEDGEIITEERDLAEKFNNYFAGVGRDIEQGIPPPLSDPLSNVPLQSNSFFVDPVTEVEVNLIVKKLKNSSYGTDSVPVFVFKKISHIVSPILAKLINKSFSDGIFPCSLKNASVIPVFKGGSRDTLSHYRPISILPLLSKIFEKAMVIRLNKFIEKFNVISDRQFGFRSGKSTVDALVDFLESVYGGLNEKKHVLSIFVDLRKAFDSVNHKILIRKLHRLGIRGVAQSWFRSYLTSRTQCVRIGSHVSCRSDIEVGVPQGSVCGPLLFLLFINDFPNACRNSKFNLFADDTTITFSDVDYSNLLNMTNSDMSKVYRWSVDNRLCFNTTKTVAMLFTRRMHDIITPARIMVDDCVINLESVVKFLGLQIDFRLNFSEHVSYIAAKISKTIGLLYRIRDCVPEYILVNLYYSLAYPYFLYCLVIYGGTCDSHLQPLITLQKRLIRLITHEEYLAHTAPLFYRTGILKLPDLYRLVVGIYMFKHGNDTRFDRFHHNYATRNRHNIIPNYQRLQVCEKCITNSGPKIWNTIPSSIKNHENLLQFKKEYKKFLISSYV